MELRTVSRCCRFRDACSDVPQSSNDTNLVDIPLSESKDIGLGLGDDLRLEERCLAIGTELRAMTVPVDGDPLDDDDESVSPLPRSRLSTPYGVLEREFARQIHKQLTFSAMDSDNRSVFDSDSQPGRSTKSRIRPTPKQLEELRRLYNANTHPSREEREALGDKIGM